MNEPKPKKKKPKIHRYPKCMSEWCLVISLYSIYSESLLLLKQRKKNTHTRCLCAVVFVFTAHTSVNPYLYLCGLRNHMNWYWWRDTNAIRCYTNAAHNNNNKVAQTIHTVCMKRDYNWSSQIPTCTYIRVGLSSTRQYRQPHERRTKRVCMCCALRDLLQTHVYTSKEKKNAHVKWTQL